MNWRFMMFMIFLTGCASHTNEENFLKGAHKKSITDVNNMVETGKLGLPREDAKKSINPISWNARNCERSGEKTMCLWIAPYEDAMGNLHEDQKIHVVVEESRWIEKEKKS